MKRVQKKVLFALLFWGVTALSVTAQSTSTKDRVDRDVVIFERILEEMFQVEISSEKQYPQISEIRVGSNMSTDRNKSVKGSYLNGYGLELHISDPLPRQRISTEGQNIFTFKYPVKSSKDENSVELNSEGIKLRMAEFLKKYAPLFESIKDDENIIITYGIPVQSRSSVPAIFGFLNENSRQTLTDMPSVAMWVAMNDINRYKNGQLSDEALEERFRFWDLNKGDEKKHQDQSIFESILETSVESVERNYFPGSFRSAYYYIPGLGVHYNLSISMHAKVEFDNAIFRDSDNRKITVDGVLSGTAEILEKFAENLKPLDEQVDSSAVNVDSLIRRSITASDSNRVVIRGFFDQRSVSGEELSKEMKLVVDEVKKVIRNYGATLESLGDDEFLSITINWMGRNPNLPSQSKIRITKQDLMRGNPPDIKQG